MLAYRQHITVKDPEHLVLNDLPLKAGQRVEILILVKEDTDANVLNPAEAYNDNEWNKLNPDERSELETQYILNNPILMKQIQEQSEWANIPIEQLDVKD